MYVREDNLLIENNEARFFLVTNAGSCGFPVNVGLAQGREMARAIDRICDKLEQHLAEQDIGKLFEGDAALNDVQAKAAHLPERIGATANAMSEDDLGAMLEGERFDGLS